MNIGNAIKLARSARSPMTQKQLAEGITGTLYISHMETGHRLPSDPMSAQLAERMKMTQDELVLLGLELGALPDGVVRACVEFAQQELLKILRDRPRSEENA